MKTLLQLSLLILIANNLIGQTTHNISMGPSYANGQYYQLSTDATTSVAHNSWDIAFSVYGTTDAAIFINEGAAFSGTTTKLYEVPSKNFNDNITTGDFGNELKNTETSWESGAFNTIKTVSNWADYGWGVYNTGNYKVEGTALYVVELGSGAYKKLSIDTLTSGTYYFRYADLDGSNLQQKSIAKSNFTNQTLAYFSFTTNATVAVEPSTGWDWLFTRYETILDNAGTLVPYTVGGILTNRGVEAVMADGIDPSTVDIVNYSLTADSLTTIGHTWKSFSFSGGWGVDPDRVYFIKTTDNELYKIQFIDFQGSSTGQGTFIKTYLGQWTAIDKVEKSNPLQQFNLFPNPATTQLNITFSLEEVQENMRLQLTDVLGRLVFETSVDGKNGLNAIELNLESFNTGNYIVTLQSKEVFISQKVIIK